MAYPANVDGSKAPGDLTALEAASECQFWRELWDITPEEVRYYLSRTGWLCRALTRMGDGYFGVFIRAQWALTGVEIETERREYARDENKYYREVKTLNLPASSTVQFEWITEREETESPDMSYDNPTTPLDDLDVP